MGSGLLSPGHLAIVLVIALIVFGPKRLPELGRSLGHGMRGFKEAITGDDDEDGEHTAPATPGPELPSALEQPPAAATAPASPAAAAKPEPAPAAAAAPPSEPHAVPPSGQAT